MEILIILLTLPILYTLFVYVFKRTIIQHYVNKHLPTPEEFVVSTHAQHNHRDAISNKFTSPPDVDFFADMPPDTSHPWDIIHTSPNQVDMDWFDNLPAVKPDVTPKQKPHVEPLTEPTVYSPEFLPTGNMYMSAEDKAIHITSPFWYDLKDKRRAIVQDCCEQCGLHGPLDLHHIHYRTLGCETINDVRLVCRPCHDAIHAKSGYSREPLHPLLT